MTASYNWDADSGLGDLDPPSMPQMLVDLITRRDTTPAIAGGTQARTDPRAGIDDRERRYAVAAFEGEIRAVETAMTGTRNSRLNTAALKLAQLVAAGALSQADVQAALERAATGCGLVKDDGWPSVRRTIASGFRKGLREPRDLTREIKAPAKRKPNAERRGAASDIVEVSTPDDGRPVVRMRPGRLFEAVDHSENILVAAGPGPIYQRSGDLVHVTQTPALRSDGTKERQDAIAFTQPAFFLRTLARHTRFERFLAREKEWTPCDPPGKLADEYFSLGEWQLAILRQLVSTPTLRADGSLLDRAGYDALSGLYLTSALKGLSVPERPTEDDAHCANETLTALLRGFPFSDPDDQPGLSLAVAMAGLLGSVVRATLPFAPMIGITAPKAGTGKSYLVDLFAIISTGSRAACVATGGDSKEFEKALGAALIDGRALLSLDNMEQPIQGQLLCQVLSQQRAEVRVLGLSKMARPSTSVAIFATGNNLEVKGDMTRRILICKLDARKEHPEHRTFEGDLIAEAMRRRPELVSAVLTILKWRHCWQDDEPNPWERVAAATPPANYEDWFQRVCAPLIALGHVNPVLSVGQGRATDSSESALIALLEAWHARFGEEPKTCRAAIELAATSSLHSELIDAMRSVTREKEAVTSDRLGRFLRKNRDRQHGNKRLELFATKQGIGHWRVREVAG